VLAAVRPGHVVRLSLTREQKHALRDPDARLALNVVRHLVAARAASVAPERPRETFPLTEATFQAVALRLGTRVGIKRSRTLIRRLRAAHIVDEAGSYAQRFGSRYRVKLYRLSVALTAALRRKRAIGRGSRTSLGRGVVGGSIRCSGTQTADLHPM
jgi:hypothetical protein